MGSENFESSQVMHTANRVVIHYGELALKCGNRKWFERELIKNLRLSLREFSISNVENLQGRIVIEFADAYPVDSLKDKLSKVFGVAVFYPAAIAGVTISDIEQTVISCLSGRQIVTFAVRAKRIDKKLPYRSKEVNETVGGKILEIYNSAKVNLSDPKLTVGIEILPDRSYIHVDKFRGADGLPTGTGGRVACLISGGIDSPVAAWRMMRRGCEVDFIHFHSAPFTDKASIEKVEEIVKILSRWQCGRGRLMMVPLGNIQRKIVTVTSEEYRVILYRRFMVRLAEILAKELKAEALVTGEALGQVASQTLSNIATVSSVATMPILRPLIGFDKQEIVDQAIKIGTYDISIEPHQDCCQFLEPRHPITKSTIEELQKVEEALDISALIKEGLTAVERKDI